MHSMGYAPGEKAVWTDREAVVTNQCLCYHNPGQIVGTLPLVTFRLDV